MAHRTITVMHRSVDAQGRAWYDWGEMEWLHIDWSRFTFVWRLLRPPLRWLGPPPSLSALPSNPECGGGQSDTDSTSPAELRHTQSQPNASNNRHKEA